MELYSGGEGGGGGVRLLRYGPSGQFRIPPLQEAAAPRKQFPFRFRRRSKSAPRNKPSSRPTSFIESKPTANSLITYSANGEKIRNNKESPSKPEKVELVGFTSYHTENRFRDRSGGYHDEESESAPCSLSESLKSHESRTSANIKMERERLRRERLNSSGLGGGLRPWASTSSAAAAAPLVEHQKISAASRLLSAAASEREKFFEEARERFFAQSASLGSSSDLFTQFLREREERLARLTRTGYSSNSNSSLQPAAFLLPPSGVRSSTDSPLFCRRLTVLAAPPPPPPGPASVVEGSSQLTAADNSSSGSLPGFYTRRQEDSAVGEGNRGGERVNTTVPSSLSSQERDEKTTAERGEHSVNGDKEGWERPVERVIPIQILTEPLLPPNSHETHAPSFRVTPTNATMTSTNVERRRGPPPPPLLQSLLDDVRAASGVTDPASKSSLFQQPMGGFATALGFGTRFLNGDEDSAVLLRPSNGLAGTAAAARESFPGFPSFGNFPSFALPLPGDRLSLSPRTRSRQLSQKLRLAKSKSTADCPTDNYR